MTRRAGPSLGDEIRGWCGGYRHIAGVDEAGRGPMAGPVVAAAVILDPQYSAQWWSELRDSKTLTARQRGRLARRLHEDVALGIGLASHDEIDQLGLLEATRQAMLRALAALPCPPDLVLVDAVSLPEEAGADGRTPPGGGPSRSAWAQRAIVHGDALSVSIAAASIVAKVERDRLMDEYDRTYPLYGFGHNRGYCTADHMRALAQHGPCPIHRRSFAPVRDYQDGKRP